VVFLKTREVDYAEAAGNYLSLHVGKDTYLIRETMNALKLVWIQKIPSHPSLDHREYRAHQGSAALVQR